MGFTANAWALLKDTGAGFIDDNALSRGASIAYYTLFSIAPVLLIIVAIAGLVFGHDAAQGAIVGQLSGLMGEPTAKALEEMIKSADKHDAGMWAALVGVVVLIVTATGVFGEVQSAMNAIWKGQAEVLDAEPAGARASGKPGSRRDLRFLAHRLAGG